MPKQRLDTLLVQRKLAESREQAQALIRAGSVRVAGQRAVRPDAKVESAAEIEVTATRSFVSRGGTKLAEALRAFHLDPRGAIAADLGASTGGFTDCLLQAGASRVYAVDVGYGQIAYSLRRDPRVVLLERTNARYALPIPEPLDLITADVSFISLTLVLPNAIPLLKPGGHIVALVKPPFEAGKGEVGKGGVVRNPAVHAAAVAKVCLWAIEAGLRIRGIVPSPLLGPKGNREFFVLLEKEAG
ncbi:MAG: TlyA family RNA methyltransferase [Chloroflexi bacterium]|nr:TlyA family RNA methyltransferase [Chloroflexota bacterium]